MEDAREALAALLKATSAQDNEIQSAAFQTIGILLIFDVVEIELDALMESIEERVEERVEASIETSLFLLGLIYSKLKRDATIAIDLHEQLLLNDSLQVRILAGENIALLLSTIQDDDDFDLNAIRGLYQFKIAFEESCARGVSRKDKAHKVHLKQVLATLDNLANEPSVELKFKTETVEVIGWLQIRQLDALRSIIGDGLVSLVFSLLYRMSILWKILILEGCLDGQDLLLKMKI